MHSDRSMVGEGRVGVTSMESSAAKLYAEDCWLVGVAALHWLVYWVPGDNGSCRGIKPGEEEAEDWSGVPQEDPPSLLVYRRRHLTTRRRCGVLVVFGTANAGSSIRVGVITRSEAAVSDARRSDEDFKDICDRFCCNNVGEVTGERARKAAVFGVNGMGLTGWTLGELPVKEATGWWWW